MEMKTEGRQEPVMRTWQQNIWKAGAFYSGEKLQMQAGRDRSDRQRRGVSCVCGSKIQAGNRKRNFS